MWYMIPGLWGAPLKAISGFIPPMETQDFNIERSIEEHASTITYSPAAADQLGTRKVSLQSRSTPLQCNNNVENHADMA